MRATIKRFAVTAAVVLALVAGTLAAALVPGAAHAADDATHAYYVNVGSDTFTASDRAYGLGAGTKQTNGASDQAYAAGWGWSAGEAGVSEADDGTVFASFRTDPTYKFSLDAGSFTVALVVDGAVSGVTVDGQSVDAAGEGKRVLSTTVTLSEAKEIEIAATGKVAAIHIAPADAEKALLFATWTEGQVIVYGKQMSETLEGATGYFSDGTSGDVAIDYDPIAAANGVNVNFNAVTMTGTIRGTSVAVSRYGVVMPEHLVYFVNLGSSTGIPASEWKYSDADENDPYYHYNETVWEYYGKEQLKNYGKAEQYAGADKSQWGYYNTKNTATRGLRRSASYVFPFNSERFNDTSDGTTDLGVYFNDLEAGTYTVYIGTMSFWHQRTATISINGVDQAPLVIRGSRDVHVYENIEAVNGAIDVYTNGKSTDESLMNFVALQKTEDAPAAAPGALTSDGNTVALAATTLTVRGAQQGAILRLYNSVRPYALLHEEIVSAENFDGDLYTVDFGEPLTGVSTFYAMQLTDGGAGDGFLFSVTDIEGFEVTRSVEGYTSKNIVLSIKCHALSGIERFSVRKNLLVPEEFDVGGLYEMNATYTVTENGSYEIVVTSGLGVTYAETVEIDEIDHTQPEMSVVPTGDWSEGYAFRVTLATDTPVKTFQLLKDGVELKTETSLPESVEIDEPGTYVFYIVSATGLTTSKTVTIGEKPVLTSIARKDTKNQMTLTYSGDYANVTAYKLANGTATRQMIYGEVGSNTLNAYDSGTYISLVELKDGSLEVFASIYDSSSPMPAETTKKKGCGSDFGTPAILLALALIGAAGGAIACRRKRA